MTKADTACETVLVYDAVCWTGFKISATTGEGIVYSTRISFHLLMLCSRNYQTWLFYKHRLKKKSLRHVLTNFLAIFTVILRIHTNNVVMLSNDSYKSATDIHARTITAARDEIHEKNSRIHLGQITKQIDKLQRI